jgi:uncharacterized protein (TIGR02246 family)
MGEAEDVLAIHALVARWCDALNRRDFAAAASLFTDDGVWAPPGAEARGPAAIEALLAQLIGPLEVLVQYATNPMVTVEGDRATARWQVQEVGRSPDAKTVTVAGTYDDRLTRSAGTWRFTERRFTLLLFATHPSEAMVRPFG